MVNVELEDWGSSQWDQDLCTTGQIRCRYVMFWKGSIRALIFVNEALYFLV